MVVSGPPGPWILCTMHSKPRQLTKRLLVSAAAATLLLGAAACGGDDDDDEGASATTADAAATDAPTTTEGMDHSTMATDAPVATEAPDTTDATDDTAAAPAGDVDTFCQAKLATEAAANSDDPSAAQPAFEALVRGGAGRDLRCGRGRDRQRRAGPRVAGVRRRHTAR